MSVAAYNETHLLCHSSCGSEIQGWLSWALLLRVSKGNVQVLAGIAVSSEVRAFSSVSCGHQQNSFLAAVQLMETFFSKASRREDKCLLLPVSHLLVPFEDPT